MVIFNEVRSYFEKITIKKLKDESFIENELILKFGLNNELLSEQPKELYDYYGKGFGLRIWQYPNQFSKYLKYLSSKKINSYLEIGCRFGGTFILTTEYLNRLNFNFSESVSVDIIDSCNLLQEYVEFNDNASFKKINSSSSEFKKYIESNFFDLIFIDGDHSYDGVKNDSIITKDKCNIQVFHDILSDACPGVTQWWNEVKECYVDTHDFYEFTDQYDSVNGSYLGIGVATRKNWINEI